MSNPGDFVDITETPSLNCVYDAASDYAARNWPVLPTLVTTKAPACAGGSKSATIDQDTIRGWFCQGNGSNVAILTGDRSGLLIVDNDPRNGGTESQERLSAAIGGLPETVTVETGGGGRHLYYYVSPADGVGLGTKKLPSYPGLDLLYGGYAVAPPSAHASGAQYRWATGLGPDEIEMAIAPPALLQLMKQATTRPASASHPPSSGGAILEGSRNDLLFRRACGLRALGLSAAEMRGAIHQLNSEQCRPPLEEGEVDSIIASAQKYDPADHFERTDLGNARRLVDGLNGDAHYVPEWKKWLISSFTHWKEDGDQEILRRAKACADAMLAEARLIRDTDKRKTAIAWAHTSQSKAKLQAMVDLAQSEPGIPLTAGVLDTSRHLLNTLSGTVDLRTGEQHPHRREDLITRVVPHGYDPAAKCPTWTSLNHQVANGQEGLSEFLQRVAGYGATGETREQCLFLLYGSGANGKSTWLNGVRHVLGPYSMQTAAETLLAKQGSGGISNDIARLRGARFVIASEIDDGRTMAQALVKEMTGGEALTARFLFHEFFEYTPEFKLLIGTNHRPQLNGCDLAIWRRIRQVPFTLVVPPEEQDRDLNRKIAEEGEGILAWIVRGAVEWYATGLVPPACVLEATEEYRRDMDVIGGFLEDRCEAADTWIRASTLFGAYRYWSMREGREPLSQNAFGRALGKRGYEGEKKAGLKQWFGLTLLPDVEMMSQ